MLLGLESLLFVFQNTWDLRIPQEFGVFRGIDRVKCNSGAMSMINRRGCDEIDRFFGG